MGRRGGLPLALLILAGLGLSGTALVGLVGFFSWLSLGTPYLWDVQPAPSQENQFGIVRNAVTAGAALGLGVTLLLSYRRQKTNEQSQEIAARALQVSARAQETSAEALQLANKQHQLDVARRHDDAIRELHSRYGRAAEQLAHAEAAVRLAGVYAMAALADDWYFHGEEDQRQACIDLLCSYYRIAGKDLTNSGSDESVREAIWSAVLFRLTPDCPEPKNWSGVVLNFRGIQKAPRELSGIAPRNVRMNFYGSDFFSGLIITDLKAEGGNADFRRIRTISAGPLLHNCRFEAAELLVGFTDDSSGKDIKFVNCEFVGGRLVLERGLQRADFIDCVFNDTTLDTLMANNLTRVNFDGCEFSGQFILQPDGQRATHLKRAELIVAKCTFNSDVPVLQGHEGQSEIRHVPAPEQEAAV